MIAPDTLTSSSALSDTDTHRPLQTPERKRSDRLKRLMDLGLGCPLLLAAMPFIGLTWAAVRLTSRGPGFYSQVRVGRSGAHYRIYKIRTMYHNCEKNTGAKWCTRNDSRITPLGRILRKLHLDELPQLWNVLKGDMSLVGPRPERPEFVKPLSEAIPGYAERHLVRPGVTGLAQIQLPPDSDVESVRTKLVLDHYYVQLGTLWLDLRIMLGTLVYLAGVSYAGVRRVLRLPNPLVAYRKKKAAGAPVRIHPGRPAKHTANAEHERDPIPCGRE
jgi:lipopolysaccharide/colanic/teichoic acid biosynthesis glycosyltransferase